jgi:hypothetical protein
MRVDRHASVVLTAVAALFLTGGTVSAQSLGVFRWQMLPHCNAVSLTVIQQGPSYTLTGNDDLCGAAQAAPVTGTAALNPDGSISLGFMVVTPNGPAAHVSAMVTLPSVSGTWRDADGNSGAFLFNGPGGGAPRPAPRTAAIITSAQLAASVFGGSGSATTIARSDHTHDDRYFTQAQTSALITAAGDAVTGPGLSLPTALSPQFIFSSLVESITTPAAGQLLITKFAQVTLACTSGARWYYITVDGSPLRSSIVYRDSATPQFSGQITGTTDGVVAPGPHQIGVGGQCFVPANFTFGGNTTLLTTSASVTVIP